MNLARKQRHLFTNFFEILAVFRYTYTRMFVENSSIYETAYKVRVKVYSVYMRATMGIVTVSKVPLVYDLNVIISATVFGLTG